MSRQKEVAIRISLGATPRSIFAQLMTESLLLALMGGVLGVAVGYAMLQALIALMPRNTIPIEADLRMNLPILGFAIAITTLAGFLFGCVPAWHASRIDPAEPLKEGGRSGVGSGRHRLRRILVISEFALALTLLAGAGLAIHSFRNLLSVDLGVRTDHVLTFFLQVPDSRPKDPERIIAYYRQMLAGIRTVPGVSHASVETGLPLEGSGFGMPFVIAGKPAVADPSQRPLTRIRNGNAGLLQDPRHSVGQGPVSERPRYVVEREGGCDQRAVRQQILQGNRSIKTTVDGGRVDSRSHQAGTCCRLAGCRGLSQRAKPGVREDYQEMEVPFWQIPWPSAGVAVRTAEDPASMTKSIAAAVHSVDPQIALSTPRTLDQVRDEVLANDRFTMILFACFAGVALLLAGIGIYGVMSFSVSQRRHEIALRMALGATRSRVVALVVKEGVALACAGLCLGLIGAYFVGRTMQSMLFGVGAVDYSAFGAVGLILLLAALLACYLPAHRAASVEPMAILRNE